MIVMLLLTCLWQGTSCPCLQNFFIQPKPWKKHFANKKYYDRHCWCVYPYLNKKRGSGLPGSSSSVAYLVSTITSGWVRETGLLLPSILKKLWAPHKHSWTQFLCAVLVLHRRANTREWVRVLVFVCNALTHHTTERNVPVWVRLRLCTGVRIQTELLCTSRYGTAQTQLNAVLVSSTSTTQKS